MRTSRLVAWIWLAACEVAPVDITQKPCPCAQGWICLASENTCAPELTTAPFALEISGPIEIPRNRSRVLTIRRIGEARRTASVRLSLPPPLAATEATLKEGATETSLTVIVPETQTGSLTGKLIANIEGIIEPYEREIALHIIEAPGELDRTFGDGGVVTLKTSSPASDPTMQRRPAVTIDSEGGVLIAHNSPPDAEIVRVTPDGRLDEAFGTGGKAALPNFVVSDLVAFPGGAAVVGRQGDNARVVRLDSSGQLVSSFGENGIVSSPPPPGFSAAYWLSVTRLSDGGLLTGGSAATPEGASWLAKLRVDGSPDPTFGNGGYLVGRPEGFLPNLISVAATANDTRILAFAQRGGETERLRLLTDSGQPDPNFQLAGNTIGMATRWQFLSGNRILGSGGGSLRVLLPGGALDAAFGMTGIAPLPFASDEAIALENGQILAAGAGDQFTTLVRILDNEREDADFGHSGRVTESFIGLPPTIRTAVRHNRIVVAAIALTHLLSPEAWVTLRRYFL